MRMVQASFPALIFQPLVVLGKLTLHSNRVTDDNLRFDTYYDVIFQNLTSLKELSIVTFPDTEFGPGFAGLTNLRVLDVSEDCELRQLTNTTLNAFRRAPILELHFYNCRHLYKLHKCAFCGFASLKTLVLGVSGAKGMTGLPKALDSLYGLRGNNMTLINMYGVQSFPVSLGRTEMQHLHSICVSTLVLSRNHIYEIKATAMMDEGSRFLECVEHIDLSRNMWMRGVGAFRQLLSRSRRLRTLQLQEQYVYSLNEASCLLGTDTQCRRRVHDGIRVDIRIVVSTTLTFVNLSSSSHALGHAPELVIIENGSSLRTLDLSFNRLNQCWMTFKGLPAIETLDLSGNNCFNISASIFSEMPTLRRLILHNFNLDPHWMHSYGLKLMRNLPVLEELDLSYNHLSRLQVDMLHAQPHLRRLKLTGKS